jgi:hypothetical protein
MIKFKFVGYEVLMDGGEYEECRLLGCDALWFLQELHGITSQKTAFFTFEFVYIITYIVSYLLYVT